MKWLGIILSLVGGIVGVVVSPDVIRLGVLCAEALHPMLVRVDPALWRQAVNLVAYSGVVVAPIAFYWPRTAGGIALFGAMAGFSLISVYHEEPLVLQKILTAFPQLQVSLFLYGLSGILIVLAAPLWFFWAANAGEPVNKATSGSGGRCKIHV